jgi:hypothetical protein
VTAEERVKERFDPSGESPWVHVLKQEGAGRGSFQNFNFLLICAGFPQ